MSLRKYRKFENFTEYKEFSIFFIILDGKELLLLICKHFFAKKELKLLAFSQKPVTNFF